MTSVLMMLLPLVQQWRQSSWCFFICKNNDVTSDGTSLYLTTWRPFSWSFLLCQNNDANHDNVAFSFQTMTSVLMMLPPTRSTLMWAPQSSHFIKRVSKRMKALITFQNSEMVSLLVEAASKQKGQEIRLDSARGRWRSWRGIQAAPGKRHAK